MKLLVILIFLIVALVPSAFAQNWPYQQQPYQTWKPWQPQPQPQLKYNPFNKGWTYEYPNESLKYNPFGNEWTYEPPGAQLRYNPFSNTWEYK